MKNDHPNGQPSRTTASDSPVLTETLRRLRNQSPRESLGLPDGSGLMKPFIQAGIVTAVLIGLLTVLPYFLDKGKTTEAKGTLPAGEKQESSETPKQATPESPVKAPSGTKGDTKAEVVSKLKENVSKPAPLSVNPLDKKDDDLLKDIK